MEAVLAQAQMITPPQAFRTVGLSRSEAEMMVRIFTGVTKFAQDFPIEFFAYCPSKKWQAVIDKAANGVATMQNRLRTNVPVIYVPAETITAIIDLGECVSGARDARLSSGKLAMMIAAGGVIGQSVFGLKYLATPAYIIALILSLGKPATAFVKEDVAEPFKPDVQTTTTAMAIMSGAQLGDHTDKAKIIERVIVTPEFRTQKFHWGTVTPTSFEAPASTCLVKGEWRARIEGWVGDEVTLTDGWRYAENSECVHARNEIGVWSPCSTTHRHTGFPPVSLYSVHEHSYWIEYFGPLTEGSCRRAGPFG